MKHKVFLIVGRTASGKTKLAKEICRRLNLKLLKSYTTRPMRDNEISDNSDHIFISADDVYKYKDRMIAYTTINKVEYFSTIDQLLESDLYIIDPKGIDYLHNSKLPNIDKCEFIEIYVRVPKSTNRRYAAQRGTSMEEFTNRYKAESAQFDYYEKNQQFRYHVLNNGTFEDVASKLEKIIRKELNR